MATKTSWTCRHTCASSSTPTASADENFRVWGSAISTAFAAMGLVKATDGTLTQINWATAVLLGSQGFKAENFEIWKFNDALQATNPVVFKILYGQGATAAHPSISIQVGHTYDAVTGAITGSLTDAMVMSITCTLTNVERTSYASGDGGRISLMLTPGTLAGTAGGFYIERTKNDSGVATATGVNVVMIGGATGQRFQQYLPASGGPNPFTASTNHLCAAPSTGTGAYAGNIGLYPIFPNMGYSGNPDLGGLVYFAGASSDITTAATEIPVTMYGTTHTYLTLGYATYASGTQVNGNSNQNSIAMRYE